MTPLVLLRHAPTVWNANGRMQGRADTTLSGEARSDLKRRKIPDAFTSYRALSSPLQRCLETAALLDLAVTPDPRLVEMDWGAYQGRTLAELRAAHGADLAANERRGLDFRPPGGESPREVQARLGPLLTEAAAANRPILAVTHRGVIRAVYACAAGWDMTDSPPHRLDRFALQVFALDRHGRPRVETLNVPLEPR